MTKVFLKVLKHSQEFCLIRLSPTLHLCVVVCSRATASFSMQPTPQWVSCWCSSAASCSCAALRWFATTRAAWSASPTGSRAWAPQRSSPTSRLSRCEKNVGVVQILPYSYNITWKGSTFTVRNKCCECDQATISAAASYVSLDTLLGVKKQACRSHKRCTLKAVRAMLEMQGSQSYCGTQFLNVGSCAPCHRLS